VLFLIKLSIKLINLISELIKHVSKLINHWNQLITKIRQPLCEIRQLNSSGALKSADQPLHLLSNQLIILCSKVS